MQYSGILSPLLLLTGLFGIATAQPAAYPNNYNVVWNSQSKNASESMPCGGGSIGTNVWVEGGEVFLYLAQSGWFDENNGLLKAGRVRLSFSPNPFIAGSTFRQELHLEDGYVSLTGSTAQLSAIVNIWVDVFKPVVHIDIKSSRPVQATAAYESWRAADRPLSTKENGANAWKWAKHVQVITQKDSIAFQQNRVVFFHQNTDSTVFDATVWQEGLLAVKDSLFNPLQHRISGGLLEGANWQAAGNGEGRYNETAFKSWKLQSRKAAKTHSLFVALDSRPASSVAQWQDSLQQTVAALTPNAWQRTKDWWHRYWQRSFIQVNPSAPNDASLAGQAGRNYQLFRYMLGCNAYGSYPTKFNGGLFTADPQYTDSSIHGTPDHRNWGGGTFTAQNQRLVYWPLLRSGDVDLMKTQFDFYNRILHNAQLRTKFYWGHAGASFTEQMENFGLPNGAEYGYNRPDDFDKGVEYNAWLEYVWDTSLEFCLMILESERYTDADISAYLPLIENCLIFFDEHYQYLARQRGIKSLDGAGHLVLYPGSAAETFKMAYNANSTIAALQTVTKALLQSQYLDTGRKAYYTGLLQCLPPLSYSRVSGHTTLAPAQSWERINNVETMQLYPVFPWGIFGIGRPGLDTAVNTYRYDTIALKFRSPVGWKQDNIWAARLGLTDEAVRLAFAKLKNSGRRFPAFWGPGFDWVPDHNWGGSGMIGLQEMLLQTDGRRLFLFPAWPAGTDVHFRLHAPYQTTVEATLKNGRLEQLKVTPEERKKDIIIMLPGSKQEAVE